MTKTETWTWRDLITPVTVLTIAGYRRYSLRL